MADLISSAVVGAIASVLLEKLIKEVKNVLAFKPVFKELASTMKDLLPIVKDIEFHKPGELKSLKDTIAKAQVLVTRCSGVKRWEVFEKAKCTKKVREIQKEMVSFCQVQLQVLQLSKQYQSAEDIKKLEDMMEDIDDNLETINKKLDRLEKNTGLLREEVKNNHGAVTEKIEDFREESKNHHEMLSEKVDRLIPANDNLDCSGLCSVRELDMVPVGLQVPLGVLRSNLLNESVKTLLVYAPPGCGKTTLVTQICHDEKIKGEFKYIFFSVVSRAPDFIKIVQDLLKHNGYPPPSFANNSQASVALEKLLEKLGKNDPILMVLDDVWHGSEFLLKNFQNNNILGYKILVTSRDKLLDYNFTYELKPLKADYAKTLLTKSAPRPDESSQAEYDDLIQKILKRCCGYPIAIEVVASTLKGQPLFVWNGQVNSWSLGETVLNNPHDRVLKCLEPSFIDLTPPLKECFMDMGSFLEDQKIHASIIIDIWVELYGKGRSSSSNVYMKYLNDLASRSLLKLIPLERKEPEDGFYNDFLVTQHDILRELAIRQSKNFPNRLLSISTDDSFSSNWVKAEALILNISSSNYAIPKFILKMKNLKVVIIINHGYFSQRLSNFSCLSSLPDLKRIRLERVSITFLEVLQLKHASLEKLSLAKCSFGEVSHDTEEIDIFKALPILQEIDIHCCFFVELPLWLFQVVSLKTLSITDCTALSKLPEELGNLRELEVLRLCSSINLYELPEATAELIYLRFLDISGCFGLKKLPLGIGKLQNLRKISMRKWSGRELPESAKELKNLVVKCDEGSTTASLWKRWKTKMSNLEVMEEELEYNFSARCYYDSWYSPARDLDVDTAGTCRIQ